MIQACLDRETTGLISWWLGADVFMTVRFSGAARPCTGGWEHCWVKSLVCYVCWRIQFLIMFRTFYDLRLGHFHFLRGEKKTLFLAHGTNTDAHRKIFDCCDVRIPPWMWICPIMGLHNLQTWCIICKCTDIFICRDNMENQWLLYFPDCWNSLLSK